MTKENKLILWAISIIEAEAKSGTYGTISFTMQNGKITNSKVERSEKPPVDLG